MNNRDKKTFIKWYKSKTPEDRRFISFIINSIAVEMFTKENRDLEELVVEMKKADAVGEVCELHPRSPDKYDIDNKSKVKKNANNR